MLAFHDRTQAVIRVVLVTIGLEDLWTEKGPSAQIADLHGKPEVFWRDRLLVHLVFDLGGLTELRGVLLRRKQPRSARARSQPLDRPRAYALLFQQKTFALVWCWLEDLCIPLRDREDVRQQVFLEAHLSFYRYDPFRARPERWLHQIAVRMAAHYHDRAVHRREMHAVEGCFEEEDAGPGSDEQIEQEEARLQLLKLLHRVDPKLRSVLIAHDLDHIPMREIAAQLGIPVSTAYKWRASVLAALVAEVKRASHR